MWFGCVSRECISRCAYTKPTNYITQTIYSPVQTMRVPRATFTRKMLLKLLKDIDWYCISQTFLMQNMKRGKIKSLCSKFTSYMELYGECKQMWDCLCILWSSCTMKQVAKNSKYAFTKVWLRQEWDWDKLREIKQTINHSSMNSSVGVAGHSCIRQKSLCWRLKPQ